MQAAVDLSPPGLEIVVFDRLAELPLYNADLEPEDQDVVVDLKESITAADAIVIATPEYNFSIPGLLKNALDWASTPPGRGPMNDKPMAIMGASPGMLGTAAAQQQLRSSVTFTRNPVVLSPEVLRRVHGRQVRRGRTARRSAHDEVARPLARRVGATRRGRLMRTPPGAMVVR